MKRIHTYFCFPMLALLLAGPAAYADDDWEAQRYRFRAARTVLLNGDMAQYHTLAQGLENYPLYYYLRYLVLSKNLSRSSVEEVQAFLQDYAGTPLVEMLEAGWLRYLARNDKWDIYVQTYTPQKSTDLQCHYQYARLQQDPPPAGVWEAVKKLWLVGKSQPKACDPLFALWYQRSPLMNQNLRWQRIHLALQNHEPGLAAYLAKSLTDQERQQWVKQWQTARSQPGKFLKTVELEDTILDRELIIYAFSRYDSKDVQAAYDLWQAYRTRYTFSSAEQAQVARGIAEAAYWQEHPDAGKWLAAIKAPYITDKIRSLHLRLTLQKQDWRALLSLIRNLPAGEQNHYQWRYWRARALEKTGKAAEAGQIYRQLAKIRDYYGFLAAEQIKQPYAMTHKPLVYQDSDYAALLRKYPGLQRAQEFYRLEMLIEARREWVHEMSKLSQSELAVAADFARKLGWFERAIFTAGQGKLYDDLDMRFPVLFKDQVQSAAQAQNIDQAWVYGIIRRESAFTVDIRSGAGALGLMQLMPATGKLMAKKLELALENTTGDILDPDTNIKLGTAYLRHVLDRFDDSRMFATAAYNAGPGRISRWIKEYGCVPGDIWVELIPFKETRNYVQRVMEYTAIFETRLGRPQTRMRLHPVHNDNCPVTEVTEKNQDQAPAG